MGKLIKFLKPYRWAVGIIIILVFIQSLCDLTLPNLMSDIVQNGILKIVIPDALKQQMAAAAAAGKSSDLFSNMNTATIDGLKKLGVTVGDIPYIWQTGGKMLLVALAGGVCTVFVSYLSSKVAVGMGRNLRNQVFEKVQNFSLTEFDKFGTASLITRTTNDIQQVQMVTVISLRMVIGAPIMAIGGIIMVLQKDIPLTSIFLIVIPILAAVIAIVATKGIPLFKVMQVKLDRLNLVLREKLTGIRVIRAYDKETFESAKFNTANKELTDTAIKVNRIMALLMPVMMLVMNVTSLAIVWFAAKRIDIGEMNLGNMMAFIQYAMLILFSLVMLSMIFVMIPRAAASAERINAVLDTVPSIMDKPLGERECTDKKGYIEFKNVTFRYPGASEPVIHNVSFSANPGETTAIIGSTGSGKSSIINLIPRFYDIEEGEILVDCVNIQNMTQEDLRSKIGYVPQKAILFSGTIADNLRYGKEDATAEELEFAARTAQAYDFIMEKPDKFEDMIAQGGTNVSGGQKQRLSIARALVRKPEIYIFDDSFSALDFKTDYALRTALKKETKDQTVIIVAQRISTVMDADRIIVLNEGRMVGMGTHKELLASNEVYKEIVYSQLSAEEIA